ncbi:MAG TPA: DMT family transporter [bacterium]|nr:DMT family transporter [bacterium]
MTPTAIVLLLISAASHATWNLLSKRRSSTASFFLLANLFGALFLTPVLWVRWEIPLTMPTSVWFLLAVTGFFQALYYISLARAYCSGDMSIAYPIARSLPVILVLIVTLLIGQASQVSLLCFAGVILIVAGCFVLPMKHYRQFKIKNYWNPTCLWALSAAVGTTGYSMVDDRALRILKASLEQSEGTQSLPVIVYALFEAISSSFWLSLFVLVPKQTRKPTLQVFRTLKGQTALTGLCIYATYVLVLISMGYVKNVSYVVAFRQLSIPLGAIMGIVLLREDRPLPKIVGVLTMFAGLILVGFS